MRYLKGDAVAAQFENIIHAETQQHDYETDLTVAQIYRLISAGELDFGGSEYQEAAREQVYAEKKTAEDDYGWWELPPGTYIMRFNETVELDEDQLGYMQPHERLMMAGGSHPTFYFRDTRDHLETLLIVGDTGLRIKENARMTKLLILQLA